MPADRPKPVRANFGYACLPCRTAKTKCVRAVKDVSVTNTTCHRCQRLELGCTMADRVPRKKRSRSKRLSKHISEASSDVSTTDQGSRLLLPVPPGSSVPTASWILGEILDEVSARMLFERFGVELNPLIDILEPEIDSFDRMHVENEVLWLSIIFTSAKLWQPPVQAALHDLFQVRLHKETTSGRGSIATVRALCILLFWRETRDQSTLARLGLAIGMAYDHRLHDHRRKKQMTGQSVGRGEEIAYRTWKCLSLMDGILSQVHDTCPMIGPLPEDAVHPILYARESLERSNTHLGACLDLLKLVRPATLFDASSCTSIGQVSKLKHCKMRCVEYGRAWHHSKRSDTTRIVMSLSSSILCELEWRIYQLRPSLAGQAAVVSAAEMAVEHLGIAAEGDSILRWFSPMFERFSAVGTILEQLSLNQPDRLSRKVLPIVERIQAFRRQLQMRHPHHPWTAVCEHFTDISRAMVERLPSAQSSVRSSRQQSPYETKSHWPDDASSWTDAIDMLACSEVETAETWMSCSVTEIQDDYEGASLSLPESAFSVHPVA